MITRVARRNPVSLSVRIPLELYQDLQGIADSLGVDLSTVVRIALVEGAPRSRSVIEDAIDEAERDGATIGTNKRTSS
jgi:predicted DNA-binding protein